MALDMAKYRRIFLEEAGDHLEEMGRALFALEKQMANTEAIDTLFRMAHSIKSMAASLGYDAVADLAHRMEDRMEGLRADGRVRDQAELALLFRSLETLEKMVAAVDDGRDPVAADADLLEQLAQPAATAEGNEAPVAESRSPDRVGGEPKKVPS
jgi:two-component system chemotaxis sensor kinase CheA